jgi:hypothetical protein
MLAYVLSGKKISCCGLRLRIVYLLVAMADTTTKTSNDQLRNDHGALLCLPVTITLLNLLHPLR